MVENITDSSFVTGSINIFQKISQGLSERITDFFVSQGFNVSVRWSSLLLFLISGLIIYLGIKISKPIIKFILIILAIILILGLIIPGW